MFKVNAIEASFSLQKSDSKKTVHLYKNATVSWTIFPEQLDTVVGPTFPFNFGWNFSLGRCLIGIFILYDWLPIDQGNVFKLINLKTVVSKKQPLLISKRFTSKTVKSNHCPRPRYASFLSI